jgi:uncharacterized membrane protein YtjA (UPF0391 family)
MDRCKATAQGLPGFMGIKPLAQNSALVIFFKINVILFLIFLNFLYSLYNPISKMMQGNPNVLYTKNNNYPLHRIFVPYGKLRT